VFLEIKHTKDFCLLLVTWESFGTNHFITTRWPSYFRDSNFCDWIRHDCVNCCVVRASKVQPIRCIGGINRWIKQRTQWQTEAQMRLGKLEAVRLLYPC